MTRNTVLISCLCGVFSGADVVAVQKLQLLPSHVRDGFVEGFLIGDDASEEVTAVLADLEESEVGVEPPRGVSQE